MSWQLVIRLLKTIASWISNRKEGRDTEDNLPSLVTDTGNNPEPAEVLVKSTSNYMWCLDNGHGLYTQGKRSPVYNDQGDIFYEYEFNRDIVKRIAKRLEDEGISYYITVPEVNVDNFLVERVRRANILETDLPKIFVSVHSNAAPTTDDNPWSTANGMEVWHYNTSRIGKRIAEIFQKYLVEATGWNDRGTKFKNSGQFYVLRATNMPAVLTENGFYNNRKQLKELLDTNVRQAIAEAHVQAILEIDTGKLI